MKKEDILIPFSAETKQGREEIWAILEEEAGLKRKKRRIENSQYF